MACSSAVRRPAHAGTFYNARPDDLRADVRCHLDAVGQLPQVGTVWGIVAPHAGHVYSGAPAAHAYRLIEGGGIRRVIVIAPSHHSWFEGVATWLGEAFETPLGPVPLDRGFTERLIARADSVSDQPAAHREEHSLEVQLPFLQEVLGEWTLVPLLVARQSWGLMRGLGDSIAAMVREETTPTLVVASSDLYHGRDVEQCRASGRRCAEAITAFDPEQFLAGVAEDRYQACGAGPIAATMVAARALGATSGQVLCLTDSSETCPGTTDRVVGYLSAVFCEN
jgi:AmmeMemoRadiSam system protein B